MYVNSLIDDIVVYPCFADICEQYSPLPKECLALLWVPGFVDEIRARVRRYAEDSVNNI